jgi:hypothetical protein
LISILGILFIFSIISSFIIFSFSFPLWFILLDNIILSSDDYLTVFLVYDLAYQPCLSAFFVVASISKRHRTNYISF